jgi:hypothetical protein
MCLLLALPLPRVFWNQASGSKTVFTVQATGLVKLMLEVAKISHYSSSTFKTLYLLRMIKNILMAANFTLPVYYNKTRFT